MRLELFDDTDVLWINPAAIESLLETTREGQPAVKLRTHTEDVHWLDDRGRAEGQSVADRINGAFSAMVED